MKILVLSKLLPHPKGISGSLIIHNRMRLLSEMGHELDLLAFANESEGVLADDIRPLVRRIRLLPPPGRFQRIPRARFFGVPYPFSALTCGDMRRAVAEMAGLHQYNVVIAEFSAMGQFIFRNPMLPAVRRIVSVHECASTAFAKAIRLRPWSPGGMLKKIQYPRLLRYECAMYGNADRILTLTGRERDAMLEHNPDLKITVVPHTADIAAYKECWSAERENAIIFVGYFSLEANRDAVLWFARSVWPALRRRFPDLVFYVVGRAATPKIRALGARDPRIKVTGEVDDIRPYLAKAKAFVCPVRMGSGFRAKLLEAMAAGVPVVSTALGAEGIPAWTGDSMLITDTAQGFLRHTSLILSDYELRRTMARNALAIVKAGFSADRSARALDSALAEAMKAGA